MDNNQSFVLLGSTGSIGTQAIDVAKKNSIYIEAISAHKNVKGIEEQARELRVKYCAMSDEVAAKDLRERLADTNIKVFSGEQGICDMISSSNSTTVLNSIIGKAGLMPTLQAIDSGKKLALANKESLVVAGETVMANARKNKISIVPVDSEHCAIHQCLSGGKREEVKKIILTASGGPFYGKSIDFVRNATIEEVLAHPTWSMGAKITVDSATLMNKGFEVIEAMHLFSAPISSIDVLVHRESIIHSMVEYIDNSVIAQMSVPDMRACIQYALSYPKRANAIIPELDLSSLMTLSFGKPDKKTFSLLDLAFYAADMGGALPAVLNAANEIAVDAFLHGKIKFGNITESVTAVLHIMERTSKLHSLEDILLADQEARIKTKELLSI